MKTLQVLAVLTIVAAAVTSRGEREEGYDTFRDVEDESQDFFTNRVQERREQLRNMLDPACLVWSRRTGQCWRGGKRSYNTRKVTLLYLNNVYVLVDFYLLKHESQVVGHSN